MNSLELQKSDVTTREDISDIVDRFYDEMLKDAIVGFIFTDVANIQLQHHLPIIVDFWNDILFKQNSYQGNALQKHLEINELIKLKSGHFTRWLYLFNKAVDHKHKGENAVLMKARAEMVAKTISATIDQRKKGEMTLTLPNG